MFDDYTTNENKDVSKVIHEEIVPNFDVTLIKTNVKQQRKEIGKSIGITETDSYMCYISSSSLKKSLWETFSKKDVDEFLRKYEFTGKRTKIRKQFDKKIPFLKNVRFRWWKK